jgi:hypothetical protein
MLPPPPVCGAPDGGDEVFTMVGVGVAVWGAGGVGAGVWDVQVGLGAGVDWHPLPLFQLDEQGVDPQLFPLPSWPWQFQPELPPPPELAAEALV